LIGGLGVGLVIPSLTGAVAATLPPSRLATGIGVQTTGRQLGSALGFAILIAVLGNPHTAQDFTGAWTFMLISSLLAGVSLLAVGGAPIGTPVPAVATSAPAGSPIGTPVPAATTSAPAGSPIGTPVPAATTSAPVGAPAVSLGDASAVGRVPV
jgi:hypothetical protein